MDAKIYGLENQSLKSFISNTQSLFIQIFNLTPVHSFKRCEVSCLLRHVVLIEYFLYPVNNIWIFFISGYQYLNISYIRLPVFEYFLYPVTSIGLFLISGYQYLNISYIRLPVSEYFLYPATSIWTILISGYQYLNISYIRSPVSEYFLYPATSI